MKQENVTVKILLNQSVFACELVMLRN